MKIRISNLYLEILGVGRNDVPANTFLFEAADTAAPDLVYTFAFVDELPQPSEGWQSVYTRPNLQVWEQQGRERRHIGIDADNPYAVYEEQDDHHISVWYLSSRRPDLQYDTIFHSCLALERHMARLGCYVLHCSFLCYHGQALLFSGNSGVGKSTHADIWCRNLPGSRVINGDRCLLVPQSDGSFRACGWPICGSSEICFNESYPLHAIVFLRQTPGNQLIDVPAAQYFRDLSAQLTINNWQRRTTIEALDFVTRLMDRVPVFTYGCNMEPAAARVLQHELLTRNIIADHAA